VNSEKVIGALVHKRGPKYQHDWPYLQSINYIKHQWWRHLWFGVFIVIWSMELIQDGGKIRRQKDIYHHGPRPIPFICHPLNPPLFSLVTTFKWRHSHTNTGTIPNFILHPLPYAPASISWQKTHRAVDRLFRGLPFCLKKLMKTSNRGLYETTSPWERVN
jgi:hypothetical protein